MRLRIKTRWLSSRGLLYGLLFVGLLGSGEARAQNAMFPGMGASEGISVYGTGEVAARPNWVEVDLRLSGRAELTGDAMVKYRDAKKRLVEALDKLGLEELSTEELGVSIGAGVSSEQQQQIINGIPQNQAKPQIEVSSTVRVRLKNIREMASEEVLKAVGRLIDVAQDTGVQIGMSAAELQQLRQRYGNYSLQGDTDVRFVVADLEDLREKAYEEAVTDARNRAMRLAKLHHVKLGTAVSVQEIQVAGDTHWAVRATLPNATAQELNDEPRISSTALTDIPVQVKLLVRFAIQPADPATAQN